MGKWLALAVLLPAMTATAAQAQMKGLSPADVADVARSRTLDFSLQRDRDFGPTPLLINGMIAQQGVADNAFVGVGLARMYSRKKRGDARITDQPTIGRKPAVTFIMKF